MEFFNGALVPGLVNAHCHLELSYLRGKIGRGCGFAGFADAISAVRNAAPLSLREESAAYWDARMRHDGVVAVGDICNGASTFGLKRTSPLRYLNFIECFGLRATDFSPMRRIAEEARSSGLHASLTPHSTYSLQDAPFRETAGEGDPLSIHFMESRGEEELFRGCGPLHDRNRRESIDIDFVSYGSPARRIAGSVNPDKNILLVHNTFATEPDIRLIEDRFRSRVSWVLCPRSNDYIEGARPPVGLLRRLGVRIAVGTDSLASNDSLSLLDELKMWPEVPLAERIGWATLGGARALGIESWAGSFEPGKRPGAVLVSGIDCERMELRENAASRRVV